MKTKKLRISHQTKVIVHMGFRKMTLTVEMPIKRIAEQAVKAAFGKLARVSNGR